MIFYSRLTLTFFFFLIQYLLAMTLVYFWRAKLREHYHTKDSFYLAL
jgi:hypothetical protein